jgi:hypothetical protein
MTIYKIDWKKVADFVNSVCFKKSGKKYSGTECKMIYMRKHKSGKVLKQIKIILDKEDVKIG